MIQATVIEDSISHSKVRLTTLQLVYPRFIHSEFLTHRAFSRNSSSSRAIPVKRMVSDVFHNPAVPVHWGRNQAGMQAFEELTGVRRYLAEKLWRLSSKTQASFAYAMSALGAHKQVANRLIEPFQHMRTIVTATDWDNWDELRLHKDADPNIQELARAIRRARYGSEPLLRGTDDPNPSEAVILADINWWHLPYISKEERELYYDRPLYLAAISTARCARVSYLNHDGTSPNVFNDLHLHDRLVGARPIHASPTEHIAFAHPMTLGSVRVKNFTGWSQYRTLVEMGVNHSMPNKEIINKLKKQG